MKLKKTSGRIRISREGWCYLVVLGFVAAGAMMRQINSLLMLTGMLVGPLVVNWLSVRRSLRKIKFERKVPDSICAGDKLVVEISCNNEHPKRAEWNVAIRDKIVRQTSNSKKDSVHCDVLLSHVASGKQEQVSYQGRVLSRGKYQFGPLMISTSSPVGLVRLSKKVDLPSTLFVYPRLGHLTSRWQDRIRKTSAPSGSASQYQRSSQGDFHSLRDWRSGDSKRLIHWRTSARRGELTIRELQPPVQTDIAILLDLWLPKKANSKWRERVEQLVSFASTLIHDASRRGGNQCLLASTGKQIHWLKGPTSAGILRDSSEHLAQVQAGRKANVDKLLQTVCSQIDSKMTVILVSTRSIELPDVKSLSLPQPQRETEYLLQRMICLSAENNDLENYFE